MKYWYFFIHHQFCIRIELTHRKMRNYNPNSITNLKSLVFTKMVADMKVGQMINFNRNETDDHWGVSKLDCLDTVVYVCGRYGGGYHEICETSRNNIKAELLDFLIQTTESTSPKDIIDWAV